jgi:plasmid stabilization system protein ParE
MRLRWTRAALSDLTRLYDILKPVNQLAAARAIQALTAAPERLLRHPRLGDRLEEFAPREVRRILVGRYEIRYELDGEAISILRLWHTREDR